MGDEYTATDFQAAIKGLSKRQRHVLGSVAFGADGGHHPKTLEALERRELIVGVTETLGGRFPVKVRRFYMPIHVHIQFCAWCAEAGEDA